MNPNPDSQSPTKLTTYLNGIDFPCGKHDIIAQAVKNQADPEVLHTMELFPEREYVSMLDVLDGYGQARE